MKYRKPTESERFNNLSLSYSSKKALAESISRRTGQSARTVERHFKSGNPTREELLALTRREKYYKVEKPRHRAEQYAKLRSKETRILPGGAKAADYIASTGSWSRGTVSGADILGMNGVEGMFFIDFIREAERGTLNGIDITKFHDQTFAALIEIFDPKTGTIDQRYIEIPMGQEFVADMWEVFRDVYPGSGSNASVSIIG